MLPIATDVLELEITPNRPDCLSVYGVAREVHAATGAPLAPPPWTDDPGAPGRGARRRRSRSQDPELCPRFTARLFEDVKLGPSPEWLKARLTAAGMRPINNVVDITNFVMLATGQPMHAFDFDLVAGGRLVVRRALDGETMTTLDDVERTLDADMLIICDDDGPTSIAGIMGGERSEVRDDDDARADGGGDLERPEHPAHVDAARPALGGLRRASRSGCSPSRAMDGQALATILMTRADRRAARRRHDRRRRPGRRTRPTIRLRDARMERLLGTAIPRDEAAEILRALEFERRRGRRRARRHGAALPARRRHARGRPRRGGRAAVGAREAAGHAARRGAARPACSRPSSGCAAAPRTRSPAPACTRSLRLERSPRPTSSTACASRPTTRAAAVVAAQPDVRGPVGAAHDAARLAAGRRRAATARAACATCGCSRSARSSSPSRAGEPTAAEQRGEPLPEERQHVGALLTGAHAPAVVARERAAAGRLLRGQGRARGAARRAARAVERRARRASRSCTPAASARVLIGGEPRRLARRDPPGGRARRGTSSDAAGFELDLGAARARGAVRAALRGPDLVPRRAARTAPGGSRPTCRPPTCSPPCARRAARCCAAPRSSTSIPPRAACRWRCGCEFRADDRTLTDEEVAQRRAKIDAAVAERLGGEPRG